MAGPLSVLHHLLECLARGGERESIASAGVAWRNARTDAEREWIIGLFAINGTLNVVWSALFFRLHRPDWALIEVVFLWLSVLVPMIVFSRYAKLANWLLPYLVWVSFAAFLNWEIVRLNGPFGS